jgi:hypothetical protein
VIAFSEDMIIFIIGKGNALWFGLTLMAATGRIYLTVQNNIFS